MEYIELEHNEPRAEMMCYHLGEYYYNQKKTLLTQLPITNALFMII